KTKPVLPGRLNAQQKLIHQARSPANFSTEIAPNMAPSGAVDAWAAANFTTFAGKLLSSPAFTTAVPVPCLTVTLSPAATPSCCNKLADIHAFGGFASAVFCNEAARRTVASAK